LLNYIIKRLFALIPVLIGVLILIFLLIHFIPGDPAISMLGEKASKEQVAEIRESLGLNEALHIQFFRYVNRLFHLDMGRSILTRNQVLVEISNRFPATVELTIFAMIFAVGIGVPIGILSAINHNSWFDTLCMVGALIGVSMPIFWLGLMLIWLFAVNLGLLPSSSRLTIGIELNNITNLYILDSILQGNFKAFIDSLKHLILPSIALGSIPMSMIARMTRSSMLEVIKKDYIRTAYAKGLKNRVVIYKHALKNALIPIITVIGLQVGILLGGAILTETIFSWPGLGKFLIDAIYKRDYPTVQGVVLFFSLVFVLVNLFVDLLYTTVDPRIEYN